MKTCLDLKMTKRERMKMRRNAATREAANTAGSSIAAIESRCACPRKAIDGQLMVNIPFN